MLAQHPPTHPQHNTCSRLTFGKLLLNAEHRGMAGSRSTGWSYCGRRVQRQGRELALELHEGSMEFLSKFTVHQDATVRIGGAPRGRELA